VPDSTGVAGRGDWAHAEPGIVGLQESVGYVLKRLPSAGR
jgi:hypothetical protein